MMSLHVQSSFTYGCVTDYDNRRNDFAIFFFLAREIILTRKGVLENVGKLSSKSCGSVSVGNDSLRQLDRFQTMYNLKKINKKY